MPADFVMITTLIVSIGDVMINVLGHLCNGKVKTRCCCSFFEYEREDDNDDDNNELSDKEVKQINKIIDDKMKHQN
jgi:hypothetical protein